MGKNDPLNVGTDYGKLAAFRRMKRPSRGFSCVFSTGSIVANMRLTPASFQGRGQLGFADFGVTRFGCRSFVVSPNRALQPTSRAAKPAVLPRDSRLSARSLG
jgi:hypothetical protein